MQPKDEDELQDMMATGITSGSPSFVRYPRGEGVGVKRKDKPVPLEIGKAEILRKGTTCSIWAIGDFVQTALHIADHLLEKYGIKISVVNARFIKPLDEENLLKHAESHQYIVTLEDNVLMGGFGSSILEVFEKNNTSIAVKRFGWPDQFIEHGNSVHELRSKVGLDQESLTKSIEAFLLIEDQLSAPIFA